MSKYKRDTEELKEKINQLNTPKKRLLFIQDNLNNEDSKIGISNVYIWHNGSEKKIVSLYVTKTNPKYLPYVYDSILVDIFTNETVYFKHSKKRIMREEYIKTKNGYAYLNPIYKSYKNILVYPDRKVPVYVLKRIYYQINGVDINNILEKKYKKHL